MAITNLARGQTMVNYIYILAHAHTHTHTDRHARTPPGKTQSTGAVMGVQSVGAVHNLVRENRISFRHGGASGPCR